MSFEIQLDRGAGTRVQYDMKDNVVCRHQIHHGRTSTLHRDQSHGECGTLVPDCRTIVPTNTLLTVMAILIMVAMEMAI